MTLRLALLIIVVGSAFVFRPFLRIPQIPMKLSQPPESIGESLFAPLQKCEESNILGGHGAAECIKDDPESSHTIGMDAEGNYVCQDHD